MSLAHGVARNIVAAPAQPHRPVKYDPDAIAVRDALWTLPARQREALVLRYFLGRIDREIAEAMGCPVGTVKSLIHRGLARMKETLK